MSLFRCPLIALAYLVSLAAILVLPVVPAAAQKRIALVVGINDYSNLKTAKDPLNGQLAKAIADAETMGEALKALGFDVETGRNLSRAAFLIALDRLKRKISPGDAVFIFFAGHGVAFKGSNLLLPSDITPVDPESEQLMRGLAIAETDIIEALREKGAGLVILTLDACRNNPMEEFAREQARIQGRAFRSTTMRSVGLETRPTSGVFSIYSAGIGQKALDGLSTDTTERNSVFTRVFAKMLRQPGRHLSDLMEDVKAEVARLAATQIDPETRLPHRQFPAFYNETQGGPVFLAGRTTGAQPASPPAAPPLAADEVFWLTIKDASVRELFEEFLRRFPASPRASEARARLQALKPATAKRGETRAEPSATKPALSRITVTSATLGQNCGAPHGNVTLKVAAICNDREVCALAGYRVNNPDPAVGCFKAFAAEWQCTGKSGTKRGSVPAVSNETHVLTLSCK